MLGISFQCPEATGEVSRTEAFRTMIVRRSGHVVLLPMVKQEFQLLKLKPLSLTVCMGTLKLAVARSSGTLHKVIGCQLPVILIVDPVGVRITIDHPSVLGPVPIKVAGFER